MLRIEFLVLELCSELCLALGSICGCGQFLLQLRLRKDDDDVFGFSSNTSMGGFLGS